jgi:hypothetical protein
MGPVVAAPKARILISRTTTWERLMGEIAARPGENVIIVGLGARARRLEDRVLREVPEAHRVPGFNPREHVVLLNRTDDGIAWGPGEAGKALVVERERR